MKLSIIEEDKIERVVPKISQYANTQSRINAADFFANHPFHIRMEEFSRRIWAPPGPGEHLGANLVDTGPEAVARLAIIYLSAMIEDAAAYAS